MLAEIEAIKKLKANYFWYVDKKMWIELADLFTEDVQFTVRGIVVARSRDELVSFISGGLAVRKSVHQGHMPVIEVIGPATATGRWAMYDCIEAPDGSFVEGYGYYTDEYEKGSDGRWRKKNYRLDRLRGGAEWQAGSRLALASS
ncbi:MAG: nuclear transport factor 2 family protein [Chloroflexi bacterium]|nr:nuclear transport factor 2 family protein [Chloroflexota bacterium]